MPMLRSLSSEALWSGCGKKFTKRMKPLMLGILLFSVACNDTLTEPVLPPSRITPPSEVPSPPPAPAPAQEVPENSRPTLDEQVQPPVILLGEDLTISLADHFRDPDGDALTYQASSSDAGVATVDLTGDSLKISALVEGQVEIEVVGLDADGESVTLTLNVIVTASPIVNFSFAEQRVKEGRQIAVELWLAGVPTTDPPADTMRLTFTVEPAAFDLVEEALEGDWQLLNETYELEVSPADRRDTVLINIPDDEDVEHPETALRLAFSAVDSVPPYRVGPRNSMHVVIQEGICDRSVVGRTFAVLQVALARLDFDLGCHEVWTSDLHKFANVNFTGVPSSGGDLSQVVLKSDDLHDFVNLESLSFTDLDLRGMDWKGGLLEPLDNLLWLQLDGSIFGELPDSAFADVGSTLEYLSLRRLPEVPSTDGMFGGLDSVNHLDFSFAAVKEFRFTAEMMRPLISLERLDINFVEDLHPHFWYSKPFRYLSNLRQLYAVNGGVRRLVAGMFEGLDNLELLSMQENEISQLGSEHLAGLPNLEFLFFRANRLEFLPGDMFQLLPKLTVIDMRENRLTSLPENFFDGADDLEEANFLFQESEEPLPLHVSLNRIDGSRIGPGPAQVVVEIAEGAPTEINFSVVSYPEGTPETMRVEGGKLRSEPVEVVADSGRQRHLAVFSRTLENSLLFTGLELVTEGGLSLFGETETALPIPTRGTAPAYRLGDDNQQDDPGLLLDLTKYFTSSSDMERLEFRAASADSAIVTATVVHDSLHVQGIAAGEATVWIYAAVDSIAVSQEFDVTVYQRSPNWRDEFNIEWVATGGVDDHARALINSAVERWESIITGDIDNVRMPPVYEYDQSCYAKADTHIDFVDDITLLVEVAAFDGELGILGFANMCANRTVDASAPHLPALGFLVLDSADVANADPEGGFIFDIVFHEIGHALGYSEFMWGNDFKSVDGPLIRDRVGTGLTLADPHFVGPAALEEWKKLGGDRYINGASIPLESLGGAGSNNSHWRELVLDNELMTPFYNLGAVNPISELTIAAMEDIGYEVSYDLADDYEIPESSLAGARAGPPDKLIDLSGDTPAVTRYIIDETGVIRRIVEPGREGGVR